MECPHGHGELAIKQIGDVEIDVCSTCEGIWLDEGELSKILDTKQVKASPELIKEAMRLAQDETLETATANDIQCPVCQTNLRAIIYNYSSDIEIDRCINGHGLWLDKKELEKIHAHKEIWKKRSQELMQELGPELNDVREYYKNKKEHALKGGPISFIVNTVIEFFD